MNEYPQYVTAQDSALACVIRRKPRSGLIIYALMTVLDYELVVRPSMCLTMSTNYTSNNLPRVKNQRLPVQF